jgi:catecholate siderophore receptor
VWTAYVLNGWTFGYGATYQDHFLAASTANAPVLKGYTTHRAMVAYQVNERFGLQLNVNNLFDKEYFIRIRNNGWATPGDARSAMLTATFKF